MQRVLWGNTSTKNPAYSDIRYVAELIGPYTVNTMPLKTLNAFCDHGTVAVTVENDLDEARDQLKQLAELGIDLDQITGDLLDAGVKSFADDFEKLLKAIAKERQRLSSRNQPAAAPQGSKVSEPQA
ncbi:MAG: transaldolase family protein [Caldilineales bacterium]